MIITDTVDEDHSSRKTKIKLHINEMQIKCRISKKVNRRTELLMFLNQLRNLKWLQELSLFSLIISQKKLGLFLYYKYPKSQAYEENCYYVISIRSRFWLQLFSTSQNKTVILSDENEYY